MKDAQSERGCKGADDTGKSFIEYKGEASNFKQGLNEDETEGGCCRQRDEGRVRDGVTSWNWEVGCVCLENA
jgi:hypothetical protein